MWPQIMFRPLGSIGRDSIIIMCNWHKIHVMRSIREVEPYVCMCLGSLCIYIYIHIYTYKYIYVRALCMFVEDLVWCRGPLNLPPLPLTRAHKNSTRTSHNSLTDFFLRHHTNFQFLLRPLLYRSSLCSRSPNFRSSTQPSFSSNFLKHFLFFSGFVSVIC